MKVTLLPVPSVVNDLVEFVVEVGRLKIFGRDQMTPVQTISDVHVNVAGSHVGAEGHVGILKFVDVRWLRLGIMNHFTLHQVAAGYVRNVPQSPANAQRCCWSVII